MGSNSTWGLNFRTFHLVKTSQSSLCNSLLWYEISCCSCRLQASSALRPGTLSSGGSSVPSPPPPPPPPPYSSPVLNTTLTKVKEYPPPTSLPVSSQTPRTHSFTISLPRIYVSRAKGLPISVPPSHTSQPTLSTTSQAQPSQNSQLHSIPTSLRVIKKPRPIAPAPPTPLHPTVATTVGKPHVTYQHLGAAVRSSTGVITTGNQRPLTTTQVCLNLYNIIMVTLGQTILSIKESLSSFGYIM